MSFVLYNFQPANRQNAYLVLPGVKTLPINSLININIYREQSIVANLKLRIIQPIVYFIFSVTLVNTSIDDYSSLLPYIEYISYDADKNKLSFNPLQNASMAAYSIYEIIDAYNIATYDRITYSIINN